MRNALLALFVVVSTLTVAMTGSGVAGTRIAASGLRAAEHPDGTTRLVVDLGQAITFKPHLLTDPMRMVIDCDALTWQHLPSLARSVGPFLGITYAEDDHGGHMILRLGRPAEIKSAFVIPPRETAGWRFVVDVKDTTKQSFLAQAETAPPAAAPPAATQLRTASAAPKTAAPTASQPTPQPQAAPAQPAQPARMIVVTSPAAEPPPPQPVITPAMVKGGSSLSAPMPPAPVPTPAPVPVALSAPSAAPVATPTSAEEDAPPTNTALAAVQPRLQPDRDRDSGDSTDRKHDGRPIIVIDPGHGGVDPGATSVSGVYEKTITYGMARELQRQLEKTGHYRVRLTRERDIFIPLRDRIAISRRYNADLFISLHADVVKDPDIHGLSVYTLSQDASDTEAQSLADKENKADLIAGVDLSHESSDVTNILIDLAQRETMNRSAVFAGSVVEELQREIPLLANTHRFAGFAVLKAPDVPAVLIEMGYLSNPTDEMNLRQTDYRSKLARSITRAVDRYFLQGQKAKRS